MAGGKPLAGLWLDWRNPAHGDAGTALLDAATEIAQPMAPTILERRLNPESIPMSRRGAGSSPRTGSASSRRRRASSGPIPESRSGYPTASAFEPDGTLVGYVAVGGFEAGVATISHVAVVPERRGRGYINDLLAAANAAARRRGDRSVLSDVDTLNSPMLAAMERAGHLRGIRPWHVWAYRRVVAP